MKVNKPVNIINAWKSLSKKKKKLIGIIALLVLLVLAACYTVFIQPLLEKEQWVYKETTVERGMLTVGVTESGSLEYGIESETYDLNLDVSDDDDDDDDDDEETTQKYLEIEEVYVAAGQRIQAGDALLKLTDDSIESVRKLLKSAVVDAQSDYSDAEEEYDLSGLEAEIAYETNKVAQNYAGTIYRNEKASISNDITAMQIEVDNRNARIASLEEAITEAQEDYDEALADYEDIKETMSIVDTSDTTNFMTYQSEFLKLQTAYENAKSALERAQESLEENAKQITSLQKKIQQATAKQKIDKIAAEETYQETVINGDNAQITYNAELESLKETLQEALEEKEAVEEQLAEMEAFVGEDGIIYAAKDGIVTQVNYEAGDTLVNSGVMIAYATPEDMTISVDVTQEDIVQLSVGDEVEIIFSAYEDETYQGTILSIDTTATSAQTNTVSYTVVVGVLGDTDKLYGGMTADITFVTEEKEDVLYVSKKAIVEENGKTYVYAKTALGGRELVEVVTGIQNGVSIEIVSGLEEGDTIYIASKVSAEVETQQNSSTNADSAEDMSGMFNMGDMSDMPDMTNMDMSEMPDMSQMGDMPDMSEMGGSSSGGFGGDSGMSGGRGGMGGSGNMSAPSGGMEARPE